LQNSPSNSVLLRFLFICATLRFVLINKTEASQAAEPLQEVKTPEVAEALQVPEALQVS